MKKMCNINKRVLMLWLFGITMQLVFHGGCSENTPLRRALRENNRQEPPLSNYAVKLNNESNHKLVVDNGIISVTLSIPEGYIIGISYNGIDNILEVENKEQDRGYLDVVWNEPGKSSSFERIHGTKFSVITAEENLVEVSFLRIWESSMNGTSVPINIDTRYIFRGNDSGFYSYAIFDRPKGLPAVEVDQIRIVFKLQENRFNYMAIEDNMQRIMPTMEDRKMGQNLSYPEAILLTNPSNPQFRGEVDDKYQYSIENKDNKVHGWISIDSDSPMGFWMITPSNEFRNGGPNKQDLTSHAGPITLNMFVSTHYAGKEVTMSFEEGETYKKVFGPVFVYLNSATTKDSSLSLWSDAVDQLSKEVKSWPYDFPRSQDFIQPNERGKVLGRLLIQDRYIKGGTLQNAKNAYVGLALPGDAGSWQRESKGYQFWTRTDSKGYFTIENIVPGVYNLYAWVPGFIGDYKYNTSILITQGGVMNLDKLVYIPPRNGPTLWEIGVPDRSAAEFYVPDPYPTLMNKLYNDQPREKFRQYGLWDRYVDLYPNNDLEYTIGVNKFKKDWFFAHVTRNIGNNTYEPTTWKIIFEHEHDIFSGNYTLQLALASAKDAELQVRFNNPSINPPHFTTGQIGGDNAIARHGLHGLHWLFSIDISSDYFMKGKNIIYMKQSRAINSFQGVMYDYIRLESPCT
ncbi:PREDICTED: probable rhamnogalacturonate lyase B isoform X2 [Lupinus angustifolius]|uniref:probable rhamnogalacturonate lyase B isoform X1 n=1 Tax=Lupinus angustifolius TaxID=3871 RepID=UPI00092EC4F1|nr:PREDICTED: probable rhamnogalacturonate lyase B isoform X1 [Lupinus angustifolius]XP_019439241.1 PREDICTED: probable rhamnogalacturonate lyase B isoform X2 [Lupinus angustifolius]